MKFFKKLFSKKKEDVPEVEKDIGDLDDGFPKCEDCFKTLYPDSPRKTFPKSGKNKKTYCRKCWKSLKKQATQYQSTGKIPGI